MAKDKRLTQGDIVVVSLPISSGYEQAGTRPSVLVTSVIKNVAVVIPLTTNKRSAKFPYSVSILPSKTNNLDRPSVTLTIQIRAVDAKRCGNKIGKLDIEDLKKVKYQLKNYLGL